MGGRGLKHAGRYGGGGGGVIIKCSLCLYSGKALHKVMQTAM